MLRNNPTILNFLRKTSTCYSETGSEIIIHCPYCDDALRKNASSHGHLYISSNSLVFHCFRCETSGFLSTLLKDLGFDDVDALKSLGGNNLFLKKKNINISVKKNLKNDIFKKNYNFKFGNILGFEQYDRYLQFRIGSYVDYTKYLIHPDIIDGKLCAVFQNLSGSFVTARIVDSVGSYRYIRNKGIGEYYYFQDLDFDTRREIVLTEGVFDAISMYRYSLFSKDSGFYLAMLGKNYAKTVKWLVEDHLRFGIFTINLIFDIDNKNYSQKTIRICQSIVNRINNKIRIVGWIPTSFKDVGVFPEIQKV